MPAFAGGGAKGSVGALAPMERPRRDDGVKLGSGVESAVWVVWRSGSGSLPRAAWPRDDGVERIIGGLRRRNPPYELRTGLGLGGFVEHLGGDAVALDDVFSEDFVHGFAAVQSVPYAFRVDHRAGALFAAVQAAGLVDADVRDFQLLGAGLHVVP